MEKKTKILIVASILVSLPILAFLGLYLSTFAYANSSLPTQSYLGKNLGRLSYPELQQSIELANNSLLQSSLKVSHQEEETSIFAEELILDIDSDNLLLDFKFYKGKPTITQLWRDILNKEIYTPEITLDETNALEKLSVRFNTLTPTLNASIASDGTITDSQDGLSINYSNLKKSLKDKLSNPSKIKINLETEESKADVSKDDLVSVEVNVPSLQETPFNLTVDDKEFTLSLYDNLEDITFYKDAEGVQVEVSERFITNYLNEVIRPEVKVEPGKLELIYNSETNKVDFQSDERKGKDLNIEGSILSFNQSLKDRLFSGSVYAVQLTTMTLEPTLEIDPILQEQGVTELVETGYTTFRGSTTNRIHNINVGMDRFNGLIIQPGEEFSFNDNLGPVDASAGYRPELVIKSFGTIPEYGGGLCQVSSTMYRAALLSGLDITERDNHSYAVGYYAQVLGHGLDATIYPGVKDLKFVNNSGSTIVMQAYAEGTSAYFKFYGTKHIDRVELVGPVNSGYHSPGPESITVDASLPPGTVKVMDTPVTGFNSYWERIIYDKDGNTTKEEIFSDYRAVNRKLKVSPDYYSTPEPDASSEEQA